MCLMLVLVSSPKALAEIFKESQAINECMHACKTSLSGRRRNTEKESELNAYFQ